VSKSAEPDYAALLKRSLQALDQMKARLAAAEGARNEPIAIIGMACRFAGVSTPDDCWSMLRDGQDMVTEVPAERWDVDAYYDPDPDAVGKSYTRWGSFLSDVKTFDADFFGISRREAMSLDPHQRLLLELAWEALESAGVAPASLAGTRTAVHVGMASHDYGHLQSDSGIAFSGGPYVASGFAHSMASGRLAYVLGLHGPATSIDTACSSSMVAVHTAVQNLRNSEADVAIASGVNLMLSPLGSILCSRARMMSFKGRCQTFDASADGYVRGEGGAVLVMKRLSDARRDSDRILAVIRGSALNQDGRSSGLTAPNGQAQQAVIRAALANAGLSPSDISYIEAHGTGTSLGDPIEMKALGEVFGDRPADRPLMVGSVKTNIGHLEGAAGIAGLIKTVLALQNRTLPKHLHLKTPNPLIPWDQYPLAVPCETIPWDAGGAPLRAGVSSFGFSGTNAHMVLEEAPPAPAPLQTAEPAATLLTLSAKNPEALKDLAGACAAALSVPDAPPLAQFAATAAIGRSHLAERLAVTAVDGADAAGKLQAWLAGAVEPGVSRGWARSTGAPEIAFLFTGQGAQRPGMARELYDAEPVFRAAMNRCAEITAPLLPRPLLSVIWGDPEDTAHLDDTAFTQPAMFAVEYALSELWRSWGVEPSVALGHSVGEYVAACIAGVFSLEDGLNLIASRGRLMSSLPRNGGMAAIFADEAVVLELIGADGDRVAIAAVNGPDSTVVSGVSEAVTAVLERASAKGVDGAPLKVSHAFHSALMDPILDEFETIASRVTFSAPTIRLVSNLTGRFAGDEVTTPVYWRRHLREAVRFGDSLRTLYDDDYRVFVELGPAPVLLGMGQRCKLGDDAAWLPSLRSKWADRASMLDSLGQLYARGLKPAWKGLFGDPTCIRRHAAVPTYPIQREPYWFEANEHGQTHGPRLTPTRTGHPLIGGTVASPLKTYQIELDLAMQPWLGDHRILDSTPFPAAGFMELAIAAGREALGHDCGLRDLVIDEALMLPSSGAATVQVIVTPDRETNRVQVFSKALDAWRLHVSGVLTRRPEAPASEAADLVFKAPDTMTTEDAESYYRRLAATGTQYGPSFRCITSLVRDQRRVIGQIQLAAPAAGEADQYLIHPGLLDSCIQLIGGVLLGEEKDQTYLPVGVDRYDLFRPGVSGGRCFVSVNTAPDGSSLTSDFVLLGEDGEVVAHVAGLRLRRVTRAGLADARQDVQRTFEIAWDAAAAPPAQTTPVDHWLILGDAGGLGDILAAKLAETGAAVSVARRDAIYAEIANGWSIDPAEPEHWSQMFAAAAKRCGRPVSGIVGLWAIDATQLSDAPDDIEAGHRRVLEPMLHLSRAIRDISARLWIVTRGSQAVDGSVPDLVQAPAWALAGVISAEYPALESVRIDLDPAAHFGEVDLLVQTLRGGGTEDRIALRREARYVARLRPVSLDSGEPQSARLEIPERGSLSNLAWLPASRVAPGPGEVEIRVHATGLNFRDVLNALGAYPGDPGPLGNECAGIVTAVGEGVEAIAVGDEVVSMTDRSFATWVIAPAILTVRKPPSVSFTQAATVPVAFLTADYALKDIGRIKSGDRVLIHAVTGGVGMAATQIALAAGAEVIGTASSGKRNLARALGVHHVFDSRSLSFVEDVKRVTGGAGVDIVLNSLAGDFIPASLGLAARDGRFIEIGKSDDWDANKANEAFPGVSYTRLYLGEITAIDPVAMRDRLARILAECESGMLHPLPHRLYPVGQAEEAFRLMGQGQHTGKIIITQPRVVRLRPDATYAITGGLGGLGLATARWMVREGARHLVLFGRQAPSAAARAQIAELRTAGVEVMLAKADVVDTSQLAIILDEIQTSMPPLRGLVHAAGVIDDGMLSELTMERFASVMAAKVRGALNLHALTRATPLDFFVMFSAGAGLLGSPGQGNYAAANGFLDALAHVREMRGLPGLSIDWGVWSGIGMAAGVDEQHQRRWSAMGLATIDEAEGVQMLQEALYSGERPQVVAVPLIRSKLPKGGSPFLSEIASAEVGVTPGVAAGELSRRLGEETPEGRPALMIGFLSAQLNRILALGSGHKLDPRRSIVEMGMDSLMAMELRNRLLATLNVRLSVTDLLKGPSVQELSAIILGAMDFHDIGASLADADREVALL
jgi:acyl transferase domain-containing protein/NADPH:quinone reductase-like Zn-dependent oxidoreductase